MIIHNFVTIIFRKLDENGEGMRYIIVEINFCLMKYGMGDMKMKKMRRILIVLLSLCLCATLVAALAEGSLTALYTAGTRLLLETENATVSVRAEFMYNDLPFKTMDALYKQDGYNSLMDVKLHSPLAYGAARDTGFTVVANGGVAYAIDPVDNPRTYRSTGCAPSSAILSSSALSRAMVRLGGAVAAAAEGSFADRITAINLEGGTQYHVMIKEGQSPELVNAAGTVLAQLAAWRFFYQDYSMPDLEIEEDADDQNYVSVTYTDYDATLGMLYEREYGEKLPEDFFEQLWSEDEDVSRQANERYERVVAILREEIVEPLSEQYQGGIAEIRPDGSVVYYESSNQYYVEKDWPMVEFADYDATFRAYYQKVTGEELDEETLTAIYYTNNIELITAFEEIADRMIAEYEEIVRADPQRAGIFVHADGTYHMINDYDAFLSSFDYPEVATPVRMLLNHMRELELGDTDLTVNLDAEGRLTAAKGQVGIVVVDDRGVRNQLTITVDLTVDQYGETQVKEFDPKEYGVMTWAEFSESGLINDTSEPYAEPTLPETVMFDGVRYQLVVEDADGGEE